MPRKKPHTPSIVPSQADPDQRDAGAVSDVSSDVSSAEGSAIGPVGDGPLTIDDIALLLVQLEVADTSELERVRISLMRLARETDDMDASFALGGAATQVAAAAAGNDDTIRAASLARANRLLEEAITRLDAIQPTPAPVSDDAPGYALSALIQPTPTDEADLMAAMAEDPAWADVAEELAAEELAAQASALHRSGAWAAVVADDGAAVADASVEGPAAAALPDDVDLDLLRDFIAESRDCISGAEAAMLALEHDPDDEEAVNTVFRAFHTIKGTSAFMGLDAISEFAHHAESLLSRVRDREIAFEGSCADLSLRSTDMLAMMLGCVEDALAGEALLAPEGYRELMGALIALESGQVVLGRMGSAGVGMAAVGNDGPPGSGEAGLDGMAAGGVPAEGGTRGAPPNDHDGSTVAPPHHQSDAPVTAAPPAVDRRQGDRRQGDRRQGERRQGDRRQGERRQDAAAELSVRIRTDRLDRLIDMVGELVIAQSMIAQDPTLQRGLDPALGAKVTHAGKLVRDLQDLTMSMRMVPLKATVQKLSRLVRDLAQKAGKQVEFVTEGEDTEIDRNMVDVVGDPLVHMVRNAVDHGLETPAERIAAGKSPTGVLRLRAYHAGGSVCVELEDDGRGLNRTRILAKARERGIVSGDRHLSDSEVFDLIFAPGFSTAEQVTDVSGRGVGMDVVKRNVESLRGRIDIASEAGRGSTFSVRLPLTLAITDGMLVRVGQERYIVPTATIHMSFRPERSSLSTVNGRGEVVLLRDELMPIVRVHRVLDVPDAEPDPAQAILMIVGDQEKRTALMVDELLGQHQLVVKSLGGNLGTIPGVSGAAILGDGRVGLILDVVGIVASARSRTDSGDAPRNAA